MKKIKFLLLIFFFIFYLNKTVISAEIDIYKKIDLFGEVLEKMIVHIFLLQKRTNHRQILSYMEYYHRKDLKYHNQ